LLIPPPRGAFSSSGCKLFVRSDFPVCLEGTGAPRLFPTPFSGRPHSFLLLSFGEWFHCLSHLKGLPFYIEKAVTFQPPLASHAKGLIFGQACFLFSECGLFFLSDLLKIPSLRSFALPPQVDTWSPTAAHSTSF